VTCSESFDELRARPELAEGTNGNNVEIAEAQSVHAELGEAFFRFFGRIL